jgi:cytoskeletal protein CcmA (bactofilin family)
MFKRYTHSGEIKKEDEEVECTAVATSPYIPKSTVRRSSPTTVSPAPRKAENVPPRINEDIPSSPTPPAKTDIETKSKMVALPSCETDEDTPETTLGEGVIFKGQLSFQRYLHIDGYFEGELQSDGRLVVGPKGVVKSNIRMREAIIKGRVEGNLQIKERLELRGDACVHGDVIASYLKMDEGVTLIGHVQVTPQASHLPPSTEDCDS